MSGEKFYFGSVKLAKGKFKKNIVQVNSKVTFVNFVNKAFLSYTVYFKMPVFYPFLKFAKINLLKIGAGDINQKKSRIDSFVGKFAKQKPLIRLISP
jgi:hypothetical protein